MVPIQSKAIPKQSPSSNIDLQAIQQHLAEFLRGADEQQYQQNILHLISKLTNSRAAFILVLQGSQTQCSQKLIHNDIARYSSVFIETASSLAKQAAIQQKTQISHLELSQKSYHLVVTPFTREAVSLVVILELGNCAIEPFVFVTQLVAGYLPLFSVGQQTQTSLWLAQQSSFVVELLTQAISQQDLEGVCYYLVNELAQHLKCQHVAIALVRHGKCRLQALSGMAKFNRRMPLIDRFEAAMQETYREQQPIQLPQKWQQRNGQIDLCHRSLLEITKADLVISVPCCLEKEQRAFAVWSFVWQSEEGLQKSTYDLIMATTPSIAPILKIAQQAQHNIFSRNIRKLPALAKNWRAWSILGIISVVFWALLQDVTHYVYADCQLQPLVRRVVTAPFDGVLLESYFRPGDVVNTEETLARLDGRELQWELLTKQAEMHKLQKEIETQLIAEKIPEYQMATLQLQKLQTQVQLLQHKLQNLEIKSPISGIILSGDLQRVQGIAVSTGESLFEVAPLQQMLLEIAVDARDISYITVGCQGDIQLESQTEFRIPIHINHIKPISESRDLENVFICHATVDNESDSWRPGMKGKAKLQIGQRPLWWILFHRPLEWLHTEFWL